MDHKRRKKLILCWVPSHIGIAGNELADVEEAKQATYSNDVILQSSGPRGDYYTTIKINMKDK